MVTSATREWISNQVGKGLTQFDPTFSLGARSSRLRFEAVRCCAGRGVGAPKAGVPGRRSTPQASSASATLNR
jgi:hypothetical protein